MDAAAAPSEKKKKSRAPIRWRALIRKTVAILSILGYENVFGRDIEDMNASVASAAWIALLKTLPRLAACSLPSLPTVDEMLRLFKLRNNSTFVRCELCIRWSFVWGQESRSYK